MTWFNEDRLAGAVYIGFWVVLILLCIFGPDTGAGGYTDTPLDWANQPWELCDHPSHN